MPRRHEPDDGGAHLARLRPDPKPFVWTKPADDILASVARFCQRTSNSDH
jgi:hypothetical protein